MAMPSAGGSRLFVIQGASSGSLTLPGRVSDTDNNTVRPFRRTVMSIRFVALETAVVRALQRGGPDANGQAPERRISSDHNVPCRHCLKLVAEGQPFLVLAFRPFPSPQPYAEQGAIFLHAEPCSRHEPAGALPEMLASARYIIRGYCGSDRIVYGSGQIVAADDIPGASERMFEDPDIAYIHVRSATNNCYQCRIERA